MTLLKYRLTGFCWLIFNMCSFAQQEVQTAHFLNNMQAINPAFVGLSGSRSMTALYRSQWIGIEGAPKTKGFVYEVPNILRNLSGALALTNNQIGPVKNTSLNLLTSYTLSLSKKKYIAFGLRGGINIFDANYNLLKKDTSQGLDPLFFNSVQNRNAPILGVGILFYNNNFLAGLSLPNFLETTYLQPNKLLSISSKPPMLFTTAFARALSPHLIIRPSLVLKILEGSPIQTDIATAFLIKSTITLGLSYRLNLGLTGFFGYRFSTHLFVGLSYEKAATAIGRDLFNSGSTAVVFSYNFSELLKGKLPSFVF